VPHQVIGWWNYGGIYRSVAVRALPPVRIDDLLVRAEPAPGAGDAPLEVDVWLVNEGEDHLDVPVIGQVTDGGRPVALAEGLSSQPVRITPGDRAHLRFSSCIERANLWSPDAPNLYDLHLALRQGERTLDSLEVRFGVRKLEVRGTQLVLNGEPIFLRGFNRHEEYPGNGRVDPGGLLEADLRLMKELNANTVRMHYPAHPDLYRLADELGLMVFAEIPLAFIGTPLPGLTPPPASDPARGGLTDPDVWRTAEAMLRTSIGALRNHPSVVIWSVGNECGTTTDRACDLIAHLVDVARSLDTTRPVTYVSHNGLNERCFGLVDVQCVNVYKGLRSAELGEFVEQVHAMAPDKPVLITEFGMQSVRAFDGHDWCGVGHHAEVLESNWTAFRARSDFVAGALIWCLADYRVHTCDPDGHLLNKWRFCHGILSLDRQPKAPVVEAVRRIFAQEEET
jgi:beta-glucuronidase